MKALNQAAELLDFDLVFHPVEHCILLDFRLIALGNLLQKRTDYVHMIFFLLNVEWYKNETSIDNYQKL